MNQVSNGPNSRKAISPCRSYGGSWSSRISSRKQRRSGGRYLSLIDLKPEDVQTEVFMMPAANFAEKDGTFVNSRGGAQ